MKWSFSAAVSFLHCPRQWAFRLIAHHSVRDKLRREAHILRQVTTPWGWLGKLVHTSISQSAILAIRKTGTFPVDAVINETLGLAHRQEAFSRAGRYKTESKSGSDGEFFALDCHEHGGDLGAEEREMVHSRIKLAIENLAKLDALLSLIHRSRDYWPERRLTWQFDGGTVQATPDLLVIDHVASPFS